MEFISRLFINSSSCIIIGLKITINILVDYNEISSVEIVNVNNIKQHNSLFFISYIL